MATIDLYKIKIEVDGQQKVVDLTDKVDELSARLSLAATAGVAAFAALARSAVMMADSIVDTADAIGFSATKVYQLNAALQDSGGQFGDAQGLLKGFSKALDDLQSGSKETTAALNKLGLSNKNLAGLTDEQKLQLVINNLGKMQAGFERNRLAMILLGKAADGIDWAKMAEGSNKASDPQLEYNLRLAADAVGQLESAFREFQLAALAAVTPILEVIKDMNITAEDAKKTIQVLGALIAAAFSAAIVTQLAKVVTLFKTLVTTMRAAATAQAFMTALLPGGLLLVATATAAATAAYIGLGKAIEGAGNEAQRFKAISSDLDKVGMPAIQSYSDGIAKLQKQLKSGAITQEEFNRKAEELATVAKTPVDSTRTGSSKIDNSAAQRLANQQRMVEQAKAQTAQLREQLQIQNQYRQAQISLIGIEGQRGNILRQNLDLETQFAQESLDFAQRIQEEYAKGADANLEVINQLREQLMIKRDQVNVSKQLNQQEADRIAIQQQLAQEFQVANNLVGMQVDMLTEMMTFDQYLNLLGQTNREYDISSKKLNVITDSLNSIKSVTQGIIDLGGPDVLVNPLPDLQNLTSEVANFSKTLTSAYAGLEFGNEKFDEQLALIRDKLQPTIDEFRSSISQYVKDENRALLDGYIAQLELEALRHTQRMQNLDAENQKQKEMMDSYVAGMRQAMEDIAESFKPYNMAQDAIKQGWGRMSDALDEFVETGKMNFADLARSIIQDITKMILKMLVFKAIEAGLNAIFPGAGTAFSALAGRANGGPVNKNIPYMVGERGPELFIPQNNGKIVSNSDLKNTDSTRQQPSNTIYNNYYINALDAKSVAQLFAENRKAIFGANKMAEREMSYAGVR